MKITLHRQMLLNVAELFLSIERETQRQDIQAYLKGNGYENSMLNNGIRNYLKKVGIYDDNFQLTKYGSDVRDTGIFKAKEMGKYKVWIDGGKRIVFLHRVSPSSKPDSGIGPIVELEKEGFSIPVKDDVFYRFELNDQKTIGKFLNEKSQIDETISINEDSSSTVFSGNLQKDLPVSAKPILKNVEWEGASIWDVIEAIFQDDWNKNSNRLKFRIEHLSDNEIENFEKNDSGDWPPYSRSIDNVPIEPYNEQEATEWRNRLLNKEIAKNYLTEKNFDGLVLSINEKEGFSSYKDMLDKPEIKNYLKDEIEPNSQEFWHLYAPMDLNPDLTGEGVKNA